MGAGHKGTLPASIVIPMLYEKYELRRFATYEVRTEISDQVARSIRRLKTDGYVIQAGTMVRTYSIRGGQSTQVQPAITYVLSAKAKKMLGIEEQLIVKRRAYVCTGINSTDANV